MDTTIKIRSFKIDDAAQVRDLFIRVNRLLAPPHRKQAFEDYIASSLNEEIDQISSYYGREQGGFWVAVDDEKVVGMFRTEPSSAEAMELRRMYVDPAARRRGIARKLLSFAENECRRRNRPRMDLSTSGFKVMHCHSIETPDINWFAKKWRLRPATRPSVADFADIISPNSSDASRRS